MLLIVYNTQGSTEFSFLACQWLKNTYLHLLFTSSLSLDSSTSFDFIKFIHFFLKFLKKISLLSCFDVSQINHFGSDLNKGHYFWNLSIAIIPNL